MGTPKWVTTRTPLVHKMEVLLLLSRAHRAYGRKSCTAGGEETGDENEGTKAMAKECWLVSLCFRLFMFFPSARSFSLVFHVFSGFVSSYIYVFCSLCGSSCCVNSLSVCSLVFFPVLPLFLPLYFLSSSLPLSMFSPFFFCSSFLSFAFVLSLLRRDGYCCYGWCMLTVRKGSEGWCLRGLSVRLCFSGFGQKRGVWQRDEMSTSGEREKKRELKWLAGKGK